MKLWLVIVAFFALAGCSAGLTFNPYIQYIPPMGVEAGARFTPVATVTYPTTAPATTQGAKP